MKRTVILLTLIATLSSCIGELIAPDAASPETPGCNEEGELTTCTFKIGSANRTRSCIRPDETAIDDINIYAYRDGNLVKHVYESSPVTISFELNRGGTYNFYALANTGEIQMPFDEQQIDSAVNIWIATIDDLEYSIPMAWKSTEVSITDSRETVSVILERLAARIGFTLDSSLINGLKITSVCLRQCASVVRPFEEGGSKITSEEESLDGDYATQTDLDDLNSGKTIYFYTLENRQGILLPDNTDPWQKVPDALGSKSDLCTYIEAVGEFEDGFLYKGSVTYRFYLGKDNVSDFSIIRNSDMSVTLTLTGEGLTEISWKAEPDVEVQPGFAAGSLDEGMHGLDDLYIGERFWYYVTVEDELITHLGGDLSRCTLAMISEDGGSIRFDNYDNDTSKGRMYAMGTCRSAGTGTIWLCDPKGNPVAELGTAIKVQKPYLVKSFLSEVGYANNDFGIDEPPSTIINGQAKTLHVYLTDKEGYNLNNDYLTGFDLSLFSFESNPYTESSYNILGTVDITMTPGTSQSNGPAATYTISCRNDGTDSELNRELSYAIRKSSAFKFDVTENNFQITGGSTSVNLQMQKITLTVVDNGWADYYPSQLSLKVKNPSNMPLTIYAWEVNTSNNDWNAIIRNQYLDDVNNNITTYRPSYITGSYYGSSLPLYGYGLVIQSERNSDGDPYIIDGDQMVYELEGIETNDCIKVQMVDKRGQESLHHLFDVSLPSGRLYSGDISIIDNLEDGSMQFGIIYGNDPENPGWNNKGMWLYSNGNLISKPDTSLDTYTNINAINLTKLMSRFKSAPYDLVLRYDSSAGKLYASCSNGNRYGISLDVSISGTVNGYALTYPDGTWFGGQDNYCSTTFSKTVTGVTVGSSSTAIDGGAIKAGMDAIYAQTFYDSYNAIGSSNNYQRHAYPTSMSVTLRIKVNSSYGSECYPISLTWSDTSLAYYHSQDGGYYYPTISKSMPLWNFVELKRK